jgi:REP element-mobilizing transposase RayT
MARRPRLFAPGLLYHVIARGNQQRLTFLDDEDYRAYMGRLALYRTRHTVTLLAYCLMPNHVHLLARTGDVPLAKFMQGLQQSYTQWFNRRHEKVGHVFQGRYRAIVCDSEAYLLTLVRYIHLNPVRAGLVEDPGQYPYSGHRTYLAGGDTAVLDPAPLLDLLGGQQAYRRFVDAGRAEPHQAHLYQVRAQQVLGDLAFAAAVSGQRSLHAPVGPPLPLDEALGRLASALEVTVETLRGPDRSHAVSGPRALAAFVLVRRLGYRLTDVAEALARDPAGLGTAVSRLVERLDRDEALARTVSRLEKCREVKV